MEENLKLYSQKTIALATYFGGPLAAGILIRRNSLNLGREKQAVNSLILGIISTIFIFVVIFSIPEYIMEKIPDMVIPVIYTGIIYLIVEKIQGFELRAHKESNGEFYSWLKAAGVGAICMLIIVAGIFGYVFASERAYDFDNELYNKEITLYAINESEALRVFELSPTLERKVYITEYNKGIVKWNENIKILKHINELDYLPIEYVNHNEKLIEYCELRIRQFENGIKAISEKTDIYDKDTEEIVRKIEEIIAKLN